MRIHFGFATLIEASTFVALADGARRVTSSGGLTVEAPVGGRLTARLLREVERRGLDPGDIVGSRAGNVVEVSMPRAGGATDVTKGAVT